MLEAVIFDMDGVLIDSEPMYFKMNQEVFKSLKLEITEEEYGTYIGITDLDMWLIIKDKHSLMQTADELFEFQSRQNYQQLEALALKPIDGIVELLEMLKANNIKLGVASSSPTKWIFKLLEKCGVDKYFTQIISGENVKNGKPAPDIFLLAAEKLGADPSKCLVIEDAERGAKGAKAAGMRCIGYLNPSSYNQDLSIADLAIDDFSKLDMEILKKLF